MDWEPICVQDSISSIRFEQLPPSADSSNLLLKSECCDIIGRLPRKEGGYFFNNLLNGGDTSSHSLSQNLDVSPGPDPVCLLFLFLSQNQNVNSPDAVCLLFLFPFVETHTCNHSRHHSERKSVNESPKNKLSKNTFFKNTPSKNMFYSFQKKHFQISSSNVRILLVKNWIVKETCFMLSKIHYQACISNVNLWIWLWVT